MICFHCSLQDFNQSAVVNQIHLWPCTSWQWFSHSNQPWAVWTPQRHGRCATNWYLAATLVWIIWRPKFLMRVSGGVGEVHDLVCVEKTISRKLFHRSMLPIAELLRRTCKGRPKFDIRIVRRIAKLVAPSYLTVKRINLQLSNSISYSV